MTLLGYTQDLFFLRGCFPLHPPPLLLQGDLRVEMLDGVAGVGSAEVTFRLTAGVLKA